ncbi:MAG: acetolactate synthase small subunit [Lachnospiraceae bacterium]|nr:acetolactate synthase small subunit [Lachnospiraceae bacterium]MBQ8138605.1 acetolactate synthase small subunit [Lachnospiraceae bacterium]MBR1650929.1 acetolactate synthase small subunit [Lachnospiraceae bacterium]MBR4277068.1 acetolactate synthase small subunit [Lachnospiraceae bacterium]MBR6302796.1 acetolactate synthase small subunit [Lachnospiraceae bacterium]
MQKKVFQLLATNTSGVLSRISGLFSRRGYNIESITAGVTSNPEYTRITIVTSGDDEVLEQIEKQVAKLVDIKVVKELKPDESVYRELALVKVRCSAEERPSVIAITDIFRGKIVDVATDSLIIEITGDVEKIDKFLELLEGHEILELARTGMAGLSRGIETVTI